MSKDGRIVRSDPEILSGTPVFVGTLYVQSPFDYIEGGDTLGYFLRQFPVRSSSGHSIS